MNDFYLIDTHCYAWTTSPAASLVIVTYSYFSCESKNPYMSPLGLLKLVNWCFEPGQPLGIISGLKETFINKYIVERTNKAEIRREEQSEKTESCRQNLWNEMQLKGPQRLDKLRCCMSNT